MRFEEPKAPIGRGEVLADHVERRRMVTGDVVVRATIVQESGSLPRLVIAVAGDQQNPADAR